jgi:hypothetical protein
LSHIQSVSNPEDSIVDQARLANVDRQCYQHGPRELLNLPQRLGIAHRYIVDTRQGLFGNAVAQRRRQACAVPLALGQAFISQAHVIPWANSVRLNFCM